MTSSILAPPHYQQPPAMHGYGAPPQPPPPPRAYMPSSASGYGMTHGQNSAHSPSANPDEDWTKISDLAERRRIQNRIAQRNYRERKKLKRRMEDLEARASSTSPPAGVHRAMPVQHDINAPKRRPSKNGSMPAKRSPNPGAGPFGSPDPNGYIAPNSLYPGARRDSRQPSITPPPSLIGSNGSNTTSPSMPVYHPHPPAPQGAQPPYYPAPYSDAGYHSMQQNILPPPVGLGLSREQPEPWQANKPYGGDEMFGQFGLSNQYPASTTAAPYENGVAGVTTGYPEQGIYSNPPMGY